jgi:hypothetical protein
MTIINEASEVSGFYRRLALVCLHLASKCEDVSYVSIKDLLAEYRHDR